MNDVMRRYLVSCVEQKGWRVTDHNIIQVLLQCGEKVYERYLKQEKWWDEYLIIVVLGGKRIGFTFARTKGQLLPEYYGWVFDFNSIYEVEEDACYDRVSYQGKGFKRFE